MKTLGQRLKIARQGLSQQAMADRLGIPQSTWSNYEIGRNQPDLALLDRICALLGVNYEWLLFGRGPEREGGQATPEQTNTLESRVAELEKELAEAKEEVLQAKNETLKAYKLAVEAMRPTTSTHQIGLSEEDAPPEPVFHRKERLHKQPHSQTQTPDKK